MTNMEALPKNIDAEKYIIGVLVRFPDAADEAFSHLTPTDFFDLEHAKIFRAAQKQFAAGGIDPVLLAREVGAAQTLVELGMNPANAPATAVHIATEAAKIVECRRKRQLHAMFNDAAQATLNGRPSEEIFRTTVADLADFGRDKGPGERLLSDLMPASQFVQQNHSIDYLIPFNIVAGQPGVLSAKAKSLKTTVALDACVSMATAKPFLGVWPIEQPINCSILTAESGAATISESLRRIAGSKGVDIEAVDNLLVSSKCPKLQSQKWLDEIERCIEVNELRCLVIDPTYLALAGLDQNKLATVAAALDPVGDIIRRTGCTVLMVHHNRKVTPAPYGCPTLEEITGSGFAEWARFWILLNRRREWDEEAGRHWLWYVAGGSAGYGARKWLDVTEGKPSDYGGRVWRVEAVSVTTGEQHEQQQKADARAAEERRQLDDDRELVFKLLRRHPGGQSKTFIKEHCGVSGRQFPKVFAAMFQAGELVECEIMVSNHKWSGYRLASEGQSNAPK